ncbi:hypothetical protein [Paeniglutamicibacter sp.]|uniref:hypothetical protein n=1 Tax=Paeniglutamicibacter sp. TaxID=1934391 RepID=UPI00398A30EA
MKHMKRSLAAAAAVVLASLTFAAPAQAYENYSMDNSWAKSSGKVWKDDSDHMGYNLYLTDDARDGHCVYYQVQGVRNDMIDTAWGRFTVNVCGYGNRYHFSDSSRRVIPTWAPGADGFRIRACKDVNNAPDPCATASYVGTRGQWTKG